MARGTGTSTAQTRGTHRDAAANAAPADAPKAGQAGGRHAGPYGASFDGTEPDGRTRTKGLTFERRWTRPGVHPYD